MQPTTSFLLKPVKCTPTKVKEPRFILPVENLDLLEDGLLELPLHLLAGIVLGGLSVKGEKSTKVELGLLQKLNLADVDLEIC